jgi:hypothetical protein
MSIIRSVSDIALDDSRNEDEYDELENMLYGLFDGYLYDNVITKAVSLPNIPIELAKRIEAIVDKVTNHILAKLNGEVGHLEGLVR